MDRKRRRRSSAEPKFSSKEEEEEAKRVAEIARKAEERAAKRQQTQKPRANGDPSSSSTGITFRSKEERKRDAMERLRLRQEEADRRRREAEESRRKFLESTSSHASRRDRSSDRHSTKRPTSTRDEAPCASNRDEKEQEALQQLKDQYLGKKVQKKKVVKASEKFSKVFQFDWDASEDTSADLNPLYNQRLDVNLLFGRGYRAGVDLREQRKKNNFLTELSRKRQTEEQLQDERNQTLSKDEVAARRREREKALESMQAREQETVQAMETKEAQAYGSHWSDKALGQMKERDWRIFREDYDITIKGGKAPHPLRNWKEASSLPTAVFQAIEALGFDKPSPIQMQAIPIGLERRDIIGIAETGSGKTLAFMVPIIAYLYGLPPTMISRTGEQGPLALVMAPTRELALQIEQEALKLTKFTTVGPKQQEHAVKTVAVVGGQSIEDQAFKLRQGIDVVIGTPGRLMDALDNHYLVLNQCNYVVLDEADRMIDMGFEPQVERVLDAMGSLLKSEAEDEMERQISLAARGQDTRYRVTAMFSATMPPEVERLAKNYLRLPAIVKIGDEDSGKNKRINQRVLFMNPGKKRDRLIEVLGQVLKHKPRSKKEKATDGEKVIVFVNVKKECDAISKLVSSSGFRATTLHGGKSQDQREESLQDFRQGFCDVLVATDVAGRGLDIPDVTHVVNYDLPSKIENYSHRIGRTGRAGKEGEAISFLTDDDEDIMYDLKQYLTSTDMPVPTELQSHPSAKAAPGARDDRGHVIAKSKRDTVIFSK